MGYRSEVAYIIVFKDEAQREVFLTTQIAKKDDNINEALKEVRKLESNKLFYYASDVKWYTDYPDVKSHQTLMDTAVELFGDDSAGYMFYRTGEEMEDIQIENEGEYDDLWDYLAVHRSIDINIDTSKLTAVITEEGVLA